MWVFSTVTRVFSRPRFSMLPTMPAATMTRSTSLSVFLPCCSSVTLTPVAVGEDAVTAHCVSTRMPCFSNALRASCEISASSCGRISGVMSIRVTSEPMAR
ncbi:hypothetical protein G6F68_018447 [Rhizopus microsporus]|uniref:Uncharacterized protein n=1 Tax=Rhizopus delemar TaxID=936053 RepID=A0A9P6XTB9_9FUNG|nr:hypothetical protein G6F68_018447 [Rhizopus microsporus]KAG1531745.1 hypothetical protein G6F50_016536 [Rhizopus delemar]